MTRTAEGAALPAHTAAMLARCVAELRPPEDMPLSRWADSYRVISPETSTGLARWHTDAAPYQREIMDAMGDPRVRKVVLKTSAQIGKTSMLMNALGKIMHMTPCPTLMMEPTVEMGQALSKDFLSPMIRDTPVLRPLVDDKSRSAGNTILKKNFPGGHVTIVGANSPAALRMRPIKVLLADEVDAYPKSAGVEGDPLLLAEKRQTVFWDRKTIEVSTPTVKGDSRIEEEFQNSTREEWEVPCPTCGAYQPLVWAGVKFDPADLDKGIFYECAHCGAVEGEYQWKAQGAQGRFRAEDPTAAVRGFHLNTLASSFCGWREVVEKFLSAKARLDVGDAEEMKTWTNLELGETWEERGEQLEESMLAARREVYGCQVPAGVLLLTAGVDVQEDRFEVEVVGWGAGKESWGIHYRKIYGDTKDPVAWEALDAFLLTRWRKADGTELPILAVGLDTGYRSIQAYRFAKPRWGRNVYALKGKGGQSVPFLSKPSTGNRVGVHLFTVGVDAGKATIYQRLNYTPEDQRGPNYCHFPLETEAGYDEAYFTGLVSEKMVTRYKKGKRMKEWVIRDRQHQRNEPLDLRNYATAALEICNPVLDGAEERGQTSARQTRRVLNRGI